MGNYESLDAYADKWAALAGKTSGTYRGRTKFGQAQKRYESMLNAFTRVRVRYARVALKQSQRILIDEIYARYIPTKAEYRDSQRLSAAGKKQFSRLTGKQSAFAGDRQAKAELLKVMLASPQERGRATRRTGARAKQQRFRGLFNVMQARAGNRAWERFGELLRRERVEHGAEPATHTQFISLINDATNKRGVLYAKNREDLGTQGKRRNSIWTNPVVWQTRALELIKQPFIQEVRKTLDRLLGQ